MRRFYDYNGVVQRINNSVIRYDNKPIYVMSVSQSSGHLCDLDIKYLLTGKNGTCSSESKKLDTSSPPVGYVNFPKRCDTLFLERVPRRRWKAGLHQENVVITTVTGAQGSCDTSTLRSASTGKCILNDYPSFKEARDLLTKATKSDEYSHAAIGTHTFGQAFTRQLALVTTNKRKDNFELHHQGEPIATLKGDNFELFEDFFYMKEFLNKYDLTVK